MKASGTFRAGSLPSALTSSCVHRANQCLCSSSRRKGLRKHYSLAWK